MALQVFAPSDIPAAHSLFKDLGVQVTIGHHFLSGGIIGNDESKRKFVEENVDGWVECVHKLTAATKKSPQAAFFAITKLLQFEWSYLQRVSYLSDLDFQTLHDAICKHFLPALFQGNISNDEEELFFSPSMPSLSSRSRYDRSNQNSYYCIQFFKTGHTSSS